MFYYWSVFSPTAESAAIRNVDLYCGSNLCEQSFNVIYTTYETRHNFTVGCEILFLEYCIWFTTKNVDCSNVQISQFNFLKICHQLELAGTVRPGHNWQMFWTSSDFLYSCMADFRLFWDLKLLSESLRQLFQSHYYYSPSYFLIVRTIPN